MPATLSIEDRAVKKLHETMNHLEKNGGANQGIGRFKQVADVWLQVPPEEFKKVIPVIDTIQQVALIADDMMDESLIRRGIPTAHIIYGMPHTIRIITYAISYMLDKLTQTEKLELVDVYIRYLIEIFGGQGYELHLRNSGKCPTEEEYVKNVYPKTDACFYAGFGLMQELSENKQDFTEILRLLGNGYQMINDYINIRSCAYNSANGFCHDISLGEFTFPIIYAIRSHPNDHEIINILKERTKDENKVKRCLSLIEKYGGFDYTIRKVYHILKMIIAESKKFDPNYALEEMLSDCMSSLDPKAPLNITFGV